MISFISTPSEAQPRLVEDTEGAREGSFGKMSALAFDVVLTGVIYLGFSFYERVVCPLVGSVVKDRLPDRPQCLRSLTVRDKIYINFAKVVTALFVYHTYQFIVRTEVSGMCVDFMDGPAVLRSVAWMPLHLVALFIVYDFFYTLFHWALHWPPIYPLVHKHHHRQVTPFRGVDDAINVHPFEYVTGEYLHLFSLYLLSRVTPVGQLHALTAVVFIFVGGTLAGLNHTRVDLHIPYVFNVRAHDLHHLQFKYNYCQYITLWDWVFGTFKSAPNVPKVARE
ncbi:putative C-5 sterol desaturase [Trypanosoma cruzi]|uniref:Putative C-5 sterol desaturase n=1 Tax=Trypanosoma cruzi TaxID=5693 RepID=A0A2V2VAA6_TRYCR|nr:C-5 sterol desaturase [Trypanosoma cruzi cruzi]PWU91253.1 putative C-5 sterol desaturase [Trypanosoma cruzi]RNF18923.1 putative C-5 sterol desaturase [Trypanosoma cruzi]